MGRFVWGSFVLGIILFMAVPGGLSWSKEGHMMTCKIAQVPFLSIPFSF